MIEKLMTLLVGILLALAGWSLTRTFELPTQQAVVLDKVDKLQDKMEVMLDKDKEIMQQHKDIFKMLQDGGNTPSGYTYN